jgi:ABC-type transport system involved in multi-copper enzyme maturation permease subunit
MKYLALLRDSFREAMDSKVLYFTFGLSVVLILILTSMSFRPVTPADQAELICALFNWSWSLEASSKPGREPTECEVTHFEQTNNTTNIWEGDYRVVVTLKLPKAIVGTQEAKEKRAVIRLTLLAELSKLMLNKLDIQEKTSDAGGEVQYIITNQGSRVKDLPHWHHEASLFFGGFPLSYLRNSLTGSIYAIERRLVNEIGAWVIILIGVIVTAFFVPNMLQKGSLDLLLVKPITRVELLLFKYLGGLTFVFVNSVVAIGGVWLVLCLRTGIWTYGFLLTILVITFFFAILYSVSTLFGVLTRSSVLCIFVTCLAWFLLFALGWAHGFLNTPIPIRATSPSTASDDQGGDTLADSSPAMRQVGNVVYVLHAILPRTGDLGDLNADLVSRGLLSDDERRQNGLDRLSKYNWAESLGVSFAFIVVMLGLASWRFAAQDY